MSVRLALFPGGLSSTDVCTRALLGFDTGALPVSDAVLDSRGWSLPPLTIFNIEDRIT